MQKQLAVLAVVIIAATLVGSVVVSGNNFVDAKKTKAQLKAQIAKLKAQIKALKAGGVTSAEKKPLAAATKALAADETQYKGLKQVIEQRQSTTQTSSCNTNNQTISGSCNNTSTQTNTNNGNNTASNNSGL